jgi:thiamine biosynthesis protein ThiI
VNVTNPDKTVFIDIRENDRAYIYSAVIKAVGGMPVGTAGRALVLLSGGIDSPAAAFLSAKRGLCVDFIHFASPPFTSELALDKISRLREKLCPFCGEIRVWVVPFTEIQKAIHGACADQYMITIMRRFMVRIARGFARENGCDCLVTGENLSQVASQTIQGITTNNICAGDIPILRPLITFDKSEIIDLAKKIGSYDISIEPHADCCTVFVPQKPVIKPTIARCEHEEEQLDLDGLVSRALDGVYLLK